MGLVKNLYHSYTTDTAKAYQLYQICRFAAVLLGGMILVKVGYSDVDVSRYEWLLFLVYAFSFFWSMGLKNALLAYWPDLGLQDQRSILGSLFALFFMIAGLFGLGLLLYYGGDMKWLALFFLLSIPAALTEHWFILHKEAKRMFWYGIVIHLLYVATILTTSIWLGSVQAVIAGLTLWAGLKFIYGLFTLRRLGAMTFDMSLIKTFLIYAMPLMLYILFGSGMDVMDSFLVEHFFEEDMFAKFRYGAKELPVNTLLIGALTATTIPMAVTHFDKSIDDIKRRLVRFMHWMYPLSIVLLVCSPYLFKYFYNEGYQISSEIFNVYLLLLVSRILTPQVLLYAMKENNVLMWTALIELSVNLILSLILLQYFGVLGIAYATIIAYFLEKVILVSYLWFYKKISVARYIDVPVYLSWSALFVFSFFMVKYLG